MPAVAEILAAKVPTPTSLDSAGIREHWPRRLREQALFSARMTLQGYLERVQEVLVRIAEGRLDGSAARLALTDKLAELGYSPEPGTEGTLRDARSLARLNLVLKTNRQTAASLAQLAESEDPATARLYPAWSLESAGWRRTHRTDWPQRWKAAGDAVGWLGASKRRMVALKRSPIWQALGNGAGGFRDTLGNPYPPFAFGSSYTWFPVDRLEARELGILDEAVANRAPLRRAIGLLLTAATLRAIRNRAEHCPDCGRWLTGNGTCTDCQGADEAAGQGKNPDSAKVQAAEIGKGKAALVKCLEEKCDIHDAIARGDLGSISFIYGNEHGGIAHFAHRKEAIEHLPETIIRGTNSGVYENGRKCNLSYGGYTAALRLQRDGKEERWVVTAFGPNDKKEGSPR